MDGLISDDFFTLPLVLEAPDVSQSINTINCNGWQFEVTKDQPLVILGNSDLALQNMSGNQFTSIYLYQLIYSAECELYVFFRSIASFN